MACAFFLRFCCYQSPDITFRGQLGEMLLVFKANFSIPVDWTGSRRGFKATVYSGRVLFTRTQDMVWEILRFQYVHVTKLTRVLTQGYRFSKRKSHSQDQYWPLIFQHIVYLILLLILFEEPRQGTIPTSTEPDNPDQDTPEPSQKEEEEDENEGRLRSMTL